MKNMEKELERKCVVTGEIKPAEELLRFVKTPDSRLVPDFNKKLDGRGLYVSNSNTLLKKALDKNLFIKSIHLFLKIPADFLEQVEHLLYQRGLDWINLARKAGALVTGFEKVKANIEKQKVAFVIEATDAADDSSHKIEVAAQNIEVLKVYNSADLDAALNKENTVYVAVLKNNIAKEVCRNIKRYQTFLEN